MCVPKENVNENRSSETFGGFLDHSALLTATTFGAEQGRARGMGIYDVPDSFYLCSRRALKQIDRKCVILLLMTLYRKLSVYIWRRH